MAHKEPHRAKPSSGGMRKFGRNLKKCQEYRRRVGKPAGPGKPGKKRGG